jgi:hypothetical protein
MTSAAVNRPPTRRERVQFAVFIGVAAGIGCAFSLSRQPELVAHDFSYPWYGAQALFAGKNPYLAVQTAASGLPPFAPWLFYPMPAVLLAGVVAWLPPVAAGGVFFGIISGLLGYVVVRKNTVHVPIFVGAPFARAALSVQWSPLLAAAALVPGSLGWLAAVKPTTGAAGLLLRPRLKAFIGAAVFALLSILVLPTWPRYWLEAVRHVPNHHSPLVYPLGAVGLLGLLRWRTGEGRLLAAMTLVPQVPWYYDQLLLGLTARTERQSYFLAACSWIAYVAMHLTKDVTRGAFVYIEPYISLGLYLPSALVVLRHANEGDIPTWLESRIQGLPPWLRGRPGRQVGLETPNA